MNALISQLAVKLPKGNWRISTKNIERMGDCDMGDKGGKKDKDKAKKQKQRKQDDKNKDKKEKQSQGGLKKELSF